MKKILLALLFCGAALAVSATDFVAIDLNFYNLEGAITAAGKLPEGVLMGKKIRFRNPKLKGYAFPVLINLDKTQSVDIKLKVKGAGRIYPSVSCRPVPKREGWEIECLEFEFCGDASDKVPLAFRKWTSLSGDKPFVAEDGETITVKAKFKLIK